MDRSPFLKFLVRGHRVIKPAKLSPVQPSLLIYLIILFIKKYPWVTLQTPLASFTICAVSDLFN